MLQNGPPERTPARGWSDVAEASSSGVVGHFTHSTLARRGYPADFKRSFFGSRDALVRLFEGAKPMFRFDQLIRRDAIIRDVKQRHPETIPIFENLHFR